MNSIIKLFYRTRRPCIIVATQDHWCRHTQSAPTGISKSPVAHVLVSEQGFALEHLLAAIFWCLVDSSCHPSFLLEVDETVIMKETMNPISTELIFYLDFSKDWPNPGVSGWWVSASLMGISYRAFGVNLLINRWFERSTLCREARGLLLRTFSSVILYCVGLCSNKLRAIGKLSPSIINWRVGLQIVSLGVCRISTVLMLLILLLYWSLWSLPRSIFLRLLFPGNEGLLYSVSCVGLSMRCTIFG